MLKKLFKKQTTMDTVTDLKIPNHIAIIMDGNGRWAKKRKLPRNLGHKAGVEKVKTITKACSEIGVKYLTLYAFSTENWTRSEQEVSGLMDLLVFFLKNELDEMHTNNVRISTIGDLSKLPEKPRQTMLDAVEKTKSNDGIFLNIALNYGGRDEIRRSIKKIANDVKNDDLNVEAIDDKLISSYLDTAFMPDPDLMIRTSGEVRLSNYLLWQLAYTEFYFCDTFWPDFGKEALVLAIEEYSKRQRRFGKA
jgi:undecaprenyl diphosphate synthase